MELVCGQCGQTIVVEDPLEDGQNILCPFCGEKSQYSKPSRIELPAQETNRKPELYVRRPQQPNDAESEMINGRVNAVMSRARAIEDLRDRETRRKRIGNLVDIIILVVVLVGGLVGYDIWRTRVEKADAAEVDVKLAEIKADAERHKEEERQREAKTLAREAEAARAKARIEAERKAREEEALRKQHEQDSGRELFRSVFKTIQGSGLNFVSELKIKEDAYPLFYLFPGHMSNERSFVVREKDENGSDRMYVLNDRGVKSGIDTNLVATTLLAKDYIVVSSNNVYFHSARKRQHTGVISKKKPSDLTDAFFGGISKDIKVIDPDFPGLRFEIVFIPKGWKKILISDTVEFGLGYSLSKVRETIEEAFPMETTKGVKSGEKKFKRTVVFWDGSHIKKGIDGVMYVPRTPPPDRQVTQTTYHYNTWGTREYTSVRSTSDRRRERWRSLKDQAEQQDREEEEFYARQSSSVSAKMALQRTAEEQRYAEKIDGILKEGELYFRAKLK